MFRVPCARMCLVTLVNIYFFLKFLNKIIQPYTRIVPTNQVERTKCGNGFVTLGALLTLSTMGMKGDMKALQGCVQCANIQLQDELHDLSEGGVKQPFNAWKKHIY